MDAAKEVLNTQEHNQGDQDGSEGAMAVLTGEGSRAETRRARL